MTEERLHNDKGAPAQLQRSVCTVTKERLHSDNGAPAQ